MGYFLHNNAFSLQHNLIKTFYSHLTENLSILRKYPGDNTTLRIRKLQRKSNFNEVRAAKAENLSQSIPIRFIEETNYAEANGKCTRRNRFRYCS